MTILLRNSNTRMFWGRNGRWTSERSEAALFRTLEAAGERAIEFGSDALEVVLRYETPVCELVLNPSFCVVSEDKAHRYFV